MTSNLWLVAGVVAFVLLILFLGVVTAVMNRLHPERGRSRGRRRYDGERDWRDDDRRERRYDDDERRERRYGNDYRRRDEREYEERAHKEHREYQEHPVHHHRHTER
jgi:flagellar biosynthesis/type III secretory pathway M-ring protein FliF/YscJ